MIKKILKIATLSLITFIPATVFAVSPPLLTDDDLGNSMTNLSNICSSDKVNLESCKVDVHNFSISKEDKIISISDLEGNRITFNYEINEDGKITFSSTNQISEGISYEEYTKIVKKNALLAYVIVANAKGVDIEDAIAYINHIYLLNLAELNEYYKEHPNESYTYDESNFPNNVLGNLTNYIINFDDMVDYYEDDFGSPYGINSFVLNESYESVDSDTINYSQTITINSFSDFSQLNGEYDRYVDYLTTNIALIDDQPMNGAVDPTNIISDSSDTVADSTTEETSETNNTTESPKTGATLPVITVAVLSILGTLFITIRKKVIFKI